MKNFSYLLIITLSVLLAACKSEEQKSDKGDNYIEPNRENGLLYIRGKITNPDKEGPGQVALIKVLKNGAIEKLATRRVHHKTREFEFEVTAPSPTMFMIYVYGGVQQGTIIMNKNDIELEIEGRSKGYFFTKGSRDTDLMYKLKEFSAEIQNARRSMSPKEHEDWRVKKVKMFVDNALPLPIALTATDFLEHEKHGDYIRETLKTVEKEYPNSSMVINFRSNFEMAQKLMLGKAAPDVKLPIYGQDTLMLSDLKGKVVLLDFRGLKDKSAGGGGNSFINLQERYKGKLEILNISLSNEPNQATWENRIKNSPLKHIYDLQAGKHLISDAYGVKVGRTPVGYLIDPEGKILAKGNLQGNQLVVAIEKALYIAKGKDKKKE